MRTTLIIVGLSLAIAGCADFGRGPRPVVPEADTSVTADATAADSGGGDGCIDHAPIFADDVYPLITHACDLCHAAGGAAGSTALALTGDAADDYGQISALIDTSSPSASPLIQKGTGSSHGGGAVWQADGCDVDIILLWIEGGATP